MPAFDFPPNPSLNDIYTANSVTYICTEINPSVWKKLGSDTSGGSSKVAILKDEKNTGVGGGDFDQDGWRDRDLTIKEDPSNFVNLTVGGSKSSPSPGNTPGYWSLPAGKYRIDWTAPAFEVGRHKTRLVYSTTLSHISTAGLNASASFVDGSTAVGSYPGYADNQSSSFGYTVIELAQTTYFKILHYSIDETQTNYGFGYPIVTTSDSTTGSNIFTQVRIEDLSTVVKDDDNKMQQGNTSAEVIDTNGNGQFIVKTEGEDRLRVTDSGTLELRKNSPQIQLIDTDDTTENTKTQLIHDSGDLFVDLRNGADDGELIIRGKGGDTPTERYRINSDGDVVIGQTISSSNISGGGIYTRTINCGASGAQNNQPAYTVVKDFFTFNCPNGAIAGTIYAASNGNYLSASSVSHFSTQATTTNSGGTIVTAVSDNINTNTFNYTLSIFTTGSNVHTIRATVVYVHNGENQDPTTGGPKDPELTLTVMLGAANKSITVTRP